MCDKNRIFVYSEGNQIAQLYEGQIPALESLLIIENGKYKVVGVAFFVRQPDFSGYNCSYGHIDINIQEA